MNFIEYILHEQHQLSLYVTPEPPMPKPLTPVRKGTYDKKQKLHHSTFYNIPKPPISKPLIPLEDKISIFLQTPMKKVIFSPELGFIKHKTRRTKAAVIQTAASIHYKRLQKKRDEGEEMRWKGWEKKDKIGGMRGEGEGKNERGEMRGKR